MHAAFSDAVQRLQKMRTFPYWAYAKTKCSHKLTVQAARVAGTGRHGRYKVMVTTINTVVANLISSSNIERLIDMHAAQK